ncbi:MHS family MFS transporter [Rhodococcus fascians]|nr:MHS family MFS transporter [Rhodococcus fascians]MBY3998454.1 MHS family MFS transporter [Rhodococcus fascians]MBY4004551.1 MHS family MFS transporter [Rhodococcus fascians]MBY4009267.1 MHS family MFS transporter [Rhodococcus fascians]MBY4019758.1 MHS family MFS transporter [Rhodococcus fascians]
MPHVSDRPTTPGRVAVATLVGSTVEWYDFFIYGTAAALIFNRLFFPEFSPVAGTLLSFATFAVGWLARPLGGIVAGHYGDRIGRKKMLVFTLLLMGFATTAIGLLPTYEMVGIWAPILLVTLRVLQGFAVGGEYGGGVVMAVEHAPEGRRGLWGCWPQMGVPLGLILGTVVFLLLNRLPEEDFLSWGWRVPFLFSIVLVVLGMVIRLSITESPSFAHNADAGNVARMPIVEVVRVYPKQVVLLILSHMGPNTFFYTFATFVLSYATTTIGFDRQTVLIAVAIGAAVEVVAMPYFAILSDRIGRRPVYVGGLVALALSAAPFFLVLDQRNGVYLTIALAIAFGLAHGSVYGTQPSFFAEVFPARVRYTGLSLGVQVAGALFGGPLPLIATALVAAGNDRPWIFVGYMIATATISAIAAAALKPAAALSQSGEVGDVRPASV